MSQPYHHSAFKDIQAQSSAFLFFILVVLKFKLRGLCLEPFFQPFFVMSFFKVGSHKLFAWAGLEP
jgi:hypothetical protein